MNNEELVETYLKTVEAAKSGKAGLLISTTVVKVGEHK